MRESRAGSKTRVRGGYVAAVALCGPLVIAACGARTDLSLPVDMNRSDTGAPRPDASDTNDSAPMDEAGGDAASTDVGPDGPANDGGNADTGAPDTGILCAPGYHVCSGLCADPTSTETCGMSCTPCPVPANGVASCNGMACSYSCDPGYRTCSTGCCSCGDLQNDPNNCGACGHSCMGATCMNGVCGPIIVAQSLNALAIAADDANVYFTTTTGSVMQTPASGGTATQLYSSPNANFTSVAVGSGAVFFTNQVPGGDVYRIPIGGGVPPTALASENAQSEPAAVAVANGTVYFQSVPPAPQTTGAGVSSVPVGGGNVSILASGESTPFIPLIAVGGSAVYFPNGYDGIVNADVLDVPLTGGMVSTFEILVNAGEPFPSTLGLAADGQNVYYQNTWSPEGVEPAASTTLLQQPALGGGSPITLASYPYSNESAIAVDATNVYFTTSSGGAGTIARVPIGGGTVVTLATGQSEPSNIALNSTSVFWVNAGDGSIQSVPK